MCRPRNRPRVLPAPLAPHLSESPGGGGALEQSQTPQSILQNLQELSGDLTYGHRATVGMIC